MRDLTRRIGPAPCPEAGAWRIEDLGCALLVFVGLPALLLSLAFWGWSGAKARGSRAALERAADKATAFEAQRGRWPWSLEELEGGPWLDGWGYPLRYELTEAGCRLSSLGAWQRPGGSGNAQDVHLILETFDGERRRRWEDS